MKLHQCTTAAATAAAAASIATISSSNTIVVRISGLNFGPSHSSLDVAVGVGDFKEKCTVLYHNEFQLNCTLNNYHHRTGSDHPVVITTSMGTTSEKTPAFLSYQSPLLDSMNWTVPSSAQIHASTITVFGKHFGIPRVNHQLTVTVGHQHCRHIVHVNDTYLTCNVPEGIGAANLVRVTVGGQTNADSDQAIVNYVPTTMGVTPRIVQAKTIITMHGTGFVASDQLRCRFVCGNSTGGCEQESKRTASLQGKLQTLNTWSAATYLSSTSIECQAPADLSHNQWYTVVASIDGINYGTIASPQTSTVQWGLAPVVTNVDPILGIPGSEIIITGRLLR